MVLPTPPRYTTPIPNNPFYSPETTYLEGPYYPTIVGAGLTVNYATGSIEATGGGSGSGTVTSVNTGAGLTGGPITSSGTISLSTTGAAAGTYTNATITVDAYGRVFAASSGTPPISSITGTAPITVTGASAKVVSIATASTTGLGAVQLYNNTDSPSTSLALTAAQGYSLQQQIDSLLFANNLTLAGTFDAATSQMLTVTGDGSSAGFAVGSDLPLPAVGNKDYFVIVTVPGSYNPPGPTGPLTVTTGDWLLSTGTQWDLLDVGSSTPYATTTVAGSICLSTNALAQAGTDTLTALTPATARSAFVPNACYSAQGALLGGTVVPGTYAVVPLGTTGQILTVDTGSVTGFSWKNPSTAGTVSLVNTGTGLTGGPITATGTIALTNTAVTAGNYTNANITVDAQGRLTAAANGTPAIPCACITGKGALISGTGAAAVTSLPVGTNGQILTVDSTSTTGLKWATPAPDGVLCVATGTGLVGGPITTSGTICLSNTTVTAGSYTNTALTVDAQGRLTAASSGLAPVTAVTGTAPIAVTAGTTPVVSISNGSTTALGAVQLYDGVDNSSITLALTAKQGCSLQNQISALSFATNLTLAGTFDATTGVMLTATNDGAGAGFTAGNPLPAPAAGNTDYFVIVTTPGTYTPPGPTGPFPLTAGDWLLSSGTQYDMLDVGFTSAYATTTSSGSVCLSTNALAQAGTDTLTALTPSTARSAFVANACFPNKGDIVAASSTPNSPVTVAVGTAGQVLTVDSTAATGFAWKTPATSGTVTSVATGTGLTGGPIISSGTIALANTAVTAGSYTNATFTVDAQGRLTAASSGTPSDIPCACITGKGALITGTAPAAVVALPVGSDGQILVADSTCTSGLKWGAAPSTGVTSVATGTGLTGGPITTTGTVALANTAVTAGSYTNASFTVDAQGRLTAASSGTAPVTAVTGTAPIAVTTGTAPVVSIDAASTTAPGSVQLYDNVDSTSTTLALTAAQGKALQDQITALLVSGTVELAGTIDASTGFVASITSVGSADGYTVGAVLPAASAITANTYVIVTTPGTMTPPGGSATVATRGDWFLVSETSPGVYAWTFLNVGFDAPAATTTVAGIVCLSTNALAQAGTDTTTALTPAAAASAYIPKACVTGKGALVTGTAASTPTALAVGADGTFLVACSTAATGLCWAAGPAAATPTVQGLILGCTTASSTALGCNAALSVTGSSNVAIGNCALCNATSATGNVAVGSQALIAATGSQNVALGTSALAGVVAGVNNLGLGTGAGTNITTGNLNVIIGPGAQAASATGSCQLALGFSSTDNWLTGDSGKNIRPGAGIRDCASNLGTAGQVLSSTGSAIQWVSFLGDTPVGTVNWFSSSTAPSGWLVADGSAVSRSIYAALFAIVGTTYGAGDGSTTFNLPDLRGQFIRGWDAAGGTARNCDPGRVFGSNQGSAFAAHCHTATVVTGAAGRPEWLLPDPSTNLGASYPSAIAGPAIRAGGFTTTIGGTETRPTNVALLPCIKWQVTTAPSSCGIPCACITAKGGLVTGTGANTPVALPVGTDGQILMANSGSPAGLQWQTGAVGGWVNAGTIQSVGLGATTTAPTIAGDTVNNVRYRQLGPKEWELIMVLNKTAGGTVGDGDYLFTLPNGLSFDTTLPWQAAFTGGIGAQSSDWQRWVLPGFESGLTDGTTFTTWLKPVVYSATKYRLIGSASATNSNPWAFNWFRMSSGLGLRFRMQFTTT